MTSTQAKTRARAMMVVAVLLASGALAYVLPGLSIVRRMAEVRDDLQLFSVRIEGGVTLSGSLAGEAQRSLALLGDRPEVQADGVVSLKLPGRCRFDVSSIEGGRFAAVTSGGKPRVEGATPAPVSLALEHLCVLLASRSSSAGEAKELLMRHLGQLKIDVGQTSLARFGGQVVYVIGAPGERTPQLWVYKDLFLPARLRFADAQGAFWDLRLLDYTSPATGEWFPRTVELAKENEVVLRFTSLKSDVKTKLADTLF
jgi:hypothetical protein